MRAADFPFGEAGRKTICSSSVGWDDGTAVTGGTGTSTIMGRSISSEEGSPVRLVSWRNFLWRGHVRSRVR